MIKSDVGSGHHLIVDPVALELPRSCAAMSVEGAAGTYAATTVSARGSTDT